MKSLIRYALILLSLTTLNAQKNAIYFNPMPLLSLYHVNLEFGYAHEFNNGFCSDFGLGIIVPADVWNSIDTKGVGRKKGRGAVLHFEPKYFFDTNSDDQFQRFLALKTSVFVHDYESNRFLNDNFRDIARYDVKSKGFMLNLLFGYTGVRDRFFGEMSFGMGVRGINVDNNSLIPISQMSGQNRINSAAEPEEKGNYLKFTVMINYKIGFVFN
jgi:hypothetical protein